MDRDQVDEEDIASPGGYLHTREGERERETERCHQICKHTLHRVGHLI